jgi:hypothetical protein
MDYFLHAFELRTATLRCLHSIVFVYERLTSWFGILRNHRWKIFDQILAFYQETCSFGWSSDIISGLLQDFDEL